MFIKLEDTDGNDIAIRLDEVLDIIEDASDPEGVFCTINSISESYEWVVNHTLDDVLQRIAKVIRSGVGIGNTLSGSVTLPKPTPAPNPLDEPSGL